MNWHNFELFILLRISLKLNIFSSIWIRYFFDLYPLVLRKVFFGYENPKKHPNNTEKTQVKKNSNMWEITNEKKNKKQQKNTRKNTNYNKNNQIPIQNYVKNQP